MALAASGAGVVELVDHGELPGKTILDVMDGACSVSDPSYALSNGCHTNPFMLAAAPMLLAFAGSHLA